MYFLIIPGFIKYIEMSRQDMAEILQKEMHEIQPKILII